MVDQVKTQFFLADSLEEALARKSELGDSGRVVAGGTDLLLQVRSGRHRPGALIQLPLEERDPELDDGLIRVPALAPLRRLQSHALLVARLPILAEAISQIGSPQIRNAGTLGGNLGNASPAADSAPPLLVYEANLVLRSVRGERTVPVREFFTGPGQTVLDPDEVVLEVQVPCPGEDEVTLFRKFGPRGANVISSANFAARLAVRETRIHLARLAAGSVAPRPIRLLAAEEALSGLSCEDLADPEIRKLLEGSLLEDLAPISDVRGSSWYKTEAVRRTFLYLLEKVKNEQSDSV